MIETMNSPALKTDTPQRVRYGTETDYTVHINSKDVIIHCKSGTHSQGSSKVKLTNMIDYNWEMRYYQGQLVALHMEGNILALAMKGKEGGLVRLISQKTSKRTLIKNLKTDVRDVSFAFLKSEIILGCVDDMANVLIYEIEDDPNQIKYKPLLQIYHPEALTNQPSNFRILWCPYLPSADDEPDAASETAKMFVFLNGCKAEVWDLCTMMEKSQGEPIKPDENHEGYVEIAHSMHIIDVSFSSDGTAIATACLDGYVKFYQIYMVDNEKQKLLHEWIPHDGEPLSCLIFIDNILKYTSDSKIWKFAITGANHNSELKLWSCETWTCLQTIHFKIDPTSVIPNLFFKMSIDHSGQFVIMSDINNKILYVLQIERNDEEKQVAVKTISQFLLPAPFLSFYVTRAEITCTTLISNSNEDLYDAEDFDDEEDGDTNAVNVNLLVIQPKKFQKCNIVFTPESYTSNILDDRENVYEKPSVEENSENVPKLNDLQSSVTLLIQQQSNKAQMNLMIPEDFTGQVVNSRSSSSVRNSLEPSQEKSAVVDNEFDLQQKSNFASGGSSPSREVQEILSLNNSTYSNPEYYDNLSKLQEADAPVKIYPQKDQATQQNVAVAFGRESAGKELIWPKIPVVKDNGLVNNNGGGANNGAGGESCDFALSTSKEEKAKDDAYKNHLQTLNFRLTSLETALREQTVLIGSLKQEIVASGKAAAAKRDNNAHAAAAAAAEIREEVSKELDLAMSKHQLQMAKFLENLFGMHKMKEREMFDGLLASVTQIINKVMSDKIQSVVSHEMKHAIVPAVANMLDTLKHQLDVQLTQKTNQANLYLKEDIAKIVANKSLTENIGQSVANAVTPSLEKCYRDMITNTLIPSWEKVCGTMFQQISDTFYRGTKEYTSWVEGYVQQQMKTQEKGKDLILKINAANENMKLSSEDLSNSITKEVQKSMNSTFKSIQDKLLANIKDILTEEIKSGFKAQTSVIEDSVINAVRSRSVTPASHMSDSHVKFGKIQQCLTNGNGEEALKLALSAENLQYVVYVCEKVDVNTIFGGSNNLPQSCLLALIQQLSMDLTQNTEIKLNYIHSAILGLNRNDPDTKRFMNKILKDLSLQLTHFINSNPVYKYKSTASILLMAIENMVPNMFNVSM